MINTLHNKDYAAAPGWFKNWEKTGLVAWVDKNGDGKMQYCTALAYDGLPKLAKGPDGQPILGKFGERMVTNKIVPIEKSKNELRIDNDIIVLANPEIAKLHPLVVALVAAGGLAAALSTAAGLLLVIAASFSHDLMKSIISKDMSEKKELIMARAAAGVAVIIAGYFGINPPGFVAQVVAFAFGLAASSFFPIIVMGIFWKKATKEGCILGHAGRHGLHRRLHHLLPVHQPGHGQRGSLVVGDFPGRDRHHRHAVQLHHHLRRFQVHQGTAPGRAGHGAQPAVPAGTEVGRNQ